MMEELTKVDEGLYRGPMPNVEFLKQMGFRSILNLETQTRELIFGDPNYEFKEAQKYSIIYFDMAFSGIFPPKKEDVYSALGCLKYGVRPLYFHCRAGRERTGFLAAAYRMRYMGWSFDDAYKEWKQLGCRWPTHILWKNALREYKKRNK